VISPVGRVTREEMKAAAKRAREVIKDFPPGFRLLADFRWLESMDPAGGQYIAEIMGDDGKAGSGSHQGHARPAQRHWSQYPVAVSLRTKHSNHDV
jgi:hypothetical protein